MIGDGVVGAVGAFVTGACVIGAGVGGVGLVVCCGVGSVDCVGSFDCVG